ncbi:MAG: GAF domain-containing protein, partial [Deltaproteobacteria bacterium]
MAEEKVQTVQAQSVIESRSAELHSVISRLLDLSLQDISFEEMLDEVLGLITSIASFTLESKAGIWLVEDGSPDILVLKAERGFTPEQMSVCGRVPFGVCVCGRAAASKTVTHVGSISGTHAFSYEGMKEHGHYCVPIVFRGLALGVLTLYIKEGRQSDRAEECFLSSVAAVLAWGIEKKRMERELRNITYYDGLTGLPNRKLLVDRLGQILLRGKWKKRYAAV